MSTALRIAAIDALLPQTQCGKCGHPGCLPYAEGIAAGEAINKCPPGGTATLHALANLLQVAQLPLALPAIPAQIAVIREAECIGCTKCIQACPVDAIVGAAKLMHTVISDECSGCELCIAPCPVDCIDLITLAASQAAVQRERADQFRARHQARLARLARLARDDARRRAARGAPLARPGPQAAVTRTASDDDQAARLKRLKIDASMAKVAYEKVRKQVAMHPDSPFATQLDALQRASEQAAAALRAAQQPMPSTVSGAPASDEGALKRANIDVAEQHGGKPAAQLARADKVGVSAELRQLKTDLAYARADLSRLQRRADTENDTLNAALERLATAERRLQAHTSAT